MLTMPARRIKELNPDAHVVCAVRKDTAAVLRGNRYIDEIKEKVGWHDIPYMHSLYDVCIDFRYVAKTFADKECEVKFDVDIGSIFDRQKSVELDLWVNDMDHFRMKRWQQTLDAKNALDEKNGRKCRSNSWHRLISWSSGLNFDPTYLSVATDNSKEGLLPSGEFIAVSSRLPLGCWTKCWPTEKWAQLFEMFPNKVFVLLGVVKDKGLIRPNVLQLGGELTIHQTAHALSRSCGLVSEEGGLVHLAKAVGKRSVVLFGPTQRFLFGYDDNINIAGTNTCAIGYCHNQVPFWIERCRIYRDSRYCLSMRTISPEMVAAGIREGLCQ